jgi:ABC-2 type transport system ATP-binding protein
MAVIDTEGLSKRYGTTVALDGLDLQVEEGEVFGFLGPNGAGKTTTIRLLLGLIHPSAGAARVCGLDPWRDAVAVHRQLAYVPGDVSVWPHLTGAETLELLGRLHGGYDAAYRDELIERFEFDPAKKGRSYSKGNRQKVALIAALMSRAPLLLLDEPTSGLDPLMEVTFRGCVDEAKARGQTVFLSSHILAEVEALCERVGILRAGRLVEVGHVEQLRHLRTMRVMLTYRGPPPDLAGLPGVADVETGAGAARFRFSGSSDALLKRLAQYEIVDFVSEEPSLEEVFLTYYGDHP